MPGAVWEWRGLGKIRSLIACYAVITCIESISMIISSSSCVPIAYSYHAFAYTDLY